MRGDAHHENLVNVACPQCAAAVHVSWDKLARRLWCPKCRLWYRVDATGHSVETSAPATTLHVAVRSSCSGWQEHRLSVRGSAVTDWQADRISVIRRCKRPSAKILAAGGICTLLIVLLVCHGLAPQVRAAPEALPTALQERATLLAHAWLSGDLTRMLQFVDPSMDRQLRRWTSQTRRELETVYIVPSTKFDVTGVDRVAANTSHVRLRVTMLQGAGDHGELVLHQMWIQRQGQWRFLPPTALDGRQAHK